MQTDCLQDESDGLDILCNRDIENIDLLYKKNINHSKNKYWSYSIYTRTY